MKDGKIVEIGTHKELMLLNTSGEYRKLYEIQANAFKEENIYSGM